MGLGVRNGLVSQWPKWHVEWDEDDDNDDDDDDDDDAGGGGGGGGGGDDDASPADLRLSLFPDKKM